MAGIMTSFKWSSTDDALRSFASFLLRLVHNEKSMRENRLINLVCAYTPVYIYIRMCVQKH